MKLLWLAVLQNSWKSSSKQSWGTELHLLGVTEIKGTKRFSREASQEAGCQEAAGFSSQPGLRSGGSATELFGRSDKGNFTGNKSLERKACRKLVLTGDTTGNILSSALSVCIPNPSSPLGIKKLQAYTLSS